jgi:glycine amidinotransferase
MMPSPVCSHNEWDPLEEVILGSLDGAMFPHWNTINEVTVPPGEWRDIEAKVGGAGVPYPPAMVEAARRERAEFLAILRGEGVIVREVRPANFAAPFSSPDWQVKNGFCAANPRDPFLIIGDEILETPMADRGRYFEAWSYRQLFKEYFKAGARWTSAPKPQLLDELYLTDYAPAGKGEPARFILTEHEPVFDAADFVRCGRDIFAQTSNVTNHFGIEWLQRHLGDGYRVHTLQNRSSDAIHIDTTFMPLAPGKVLVSPEYLDLQQLPAVLKSWDILVPKEIIPVVHDPLRGVSSWIAINVLMLDPQRVIVEKRQEVLIRQLKDWGFKPIPCPFESHYPFLGSFHCATLDIRRRGSLQSYF